jgi:hypothetical protein
VGTRGNLLRSSVMVAVLLLVACGSDSATSGSASGGGGDTASGSSGLNPEDVALGEALAQIRGHHAASLALYRNGDRKGAMVHADHPVAEILASIQGDLDGAGPSGAELEDALRAGPQAVADGVEPDRLRSIFARAARAVSKVERAVVGDAGESASYRGSVIASLLTTAAHEYEEAVGPAGVRLLVEYQDAWAFTGEARRLYRAVASEVEAAAAEEAAEVHEAFEALAGALPSVQPPSRLASVDDVEGPAELIGHELAETVDADVKAPTAPAEVAEEIEGLLDEIVADYRAGNSEKAAELVAEAYLENYEVIEPEVIEYAPDINSELEPLLGAALRREISDGAPPAKIEDMVRRARDLLQQAVKAVEAAGAHS